MTFGPRGYTVGTERALFRVARGTCYFPDCSTPVMTPHEGHHIVGVDIAHIRGAKPGSARFDASMTDVERAAFSNLILLCVPHHKLVDRLEPERYPAAVLEGWKASNERAPDLSDLGGSVTENNLEDLLSTIVDRLSPTRQVTVDLMGGILHLPDGVLTTPLHQLGDILRRNPHLVGQQALVVADVRNVGTSPVTVDAIDIHYVIDAPGSPGEADFSLLGRDDFQGVNPGLPQRVRDSASIHWLTKIDTVLHVMDLIRKSTQQVKGIHVRVRLSSGETIDSDIVVWPSDLPGS